jgi:hypothetical protein
MRTRGLLYWSVSLALAACTASASPPTAALLTATVEPSQGALATVTQTPPPPDTPTPTPLISALPTETPTPALPCLNDVEFVSDVTVPDGAQFLPGQVFVKKWNVKNAGTCDWGPTYSLVLLSGDAMNSPTELALYPARAGANAILEIPLTAPQTPGRYSARWRARDPGGNLFGDFVSVQIEVIPLPAP